MENLKAIVTGTMAYGPATAKSDIDIVMQSPDASELVGKLEKIGIAITFSKEKDPCYNGYKFEIPPMPIFNIIVSDNPEDFESWVFATNKMRTIPYIENREDRLMIFDRFRSKFLTENKNEVDPFEDI